MNEEGRRTDNLGKMRENNANLIKNITKSFIYLTQRKNRYKELSSVVELLDQLRIDEPMLPWNFINKIQKKAFCKEKILKKVKEEKEETIASLEKSKKKIVENILQTELTVKNLEKLEKFQEYKYFILRQEGIKMVLDPSNRIKDITKHITYYNMLMYRIKKTTKLFKQLHYEYYQLLFILDSFLKFYKKNFLCSTEKMKEEIQKEEYESIVFKSLLDTIYKYQKNKDIINCLFEEIDCKRGEISKNFFLMHHYL